MSEESVMGKNIWYRNDAGSSEWHPGILLKFDVADQFFNLNTEKVERKVVAIIKNTKTGMVVVIPAHMCINFNSDPRGIK
jgi:hypothetical protein